MHNGSATRETPPGTQQGHLSGLVVKEGFSEEEAFERRHGNSGERVYGALKRLQQDFVGHQRDSKAQHPSPLRRWGCRSGGGQRLEMRLEEEPSLCRKQDGIWT